MESTQELAIRTVNSYIRIVATQCSLGTWFGSGI